MGYKLESHRQSKKSFDIESCEYINTLNIFWNFLFTYFNRNISAYKTIDF